MIQNGYPWNESDTIAIKRWKSVKTIKAVTPDPQFKISLIECLENDPEACFYQYFIHIQQVAVDFETVCFEHVMGPVFRYQLKAICNGIVGLLE